MAQPENNIKLWDRLFNRYRKEIINRGREQWGNTYPWDGSWVPNSQWYRNYVEYKIIDRVTGSETIKKEYLD